MAWIAGSSPAMTWGRRHSRHHIRSSFPRKRDSRAKLHRPAYLLWIPTCAGMTKESLSPPIPSPQDLILGSMPVFPHPADVMQMGGNGGNFPPNALCLRSFPLPPQSALAYSRRIMTEVLFYHLQQQPLERVLPVLLEKCLERGWRAVVQSGSAERMEAVDQELWTYRDETFLAHGTAKDGHEADQPVFLTTAEDNPNGAQVRFLIDRAAPPNLADYTRAIYIFDDHDPEAVTDARAHYKNALDAGHEVTYWQQSDQGRWEKRA